MTGRESSDGAAAAKKRPVQVKHGAHRVGGRQAKDLAPPPAGPPASSAATVRHTAWKGSPMRRYTRCPVHGYLAVQRWTLRNWQWIHGCEGCMDEAMSALAAIGACVGESMP